jgi:glycosyltransferase involved in cell wall biosynthesis
MSIFLCGAATELVIAGGGAAIFSGGASKPGGGARYLGRVSDQELKSLYQNALALAFPSLTEGFGLPPVEAMQCGCPVLASTGGAIPEVCGDAVMYIAPDDQAGWTEAMERIEADQTLRARLSHAGRRRAALFTWERAARALLASLAPEGAPSYDRVPAGGLKAEG